MEQRTKRKELVRDYYFQIYAKNIAKKVHVIINENDTYEKSARVGLSQRQVKLIFSLSAKEVNWLDISKKSTVQMFYLV